MTQPELIPVACTLTPEALHKRRTAALEPLFRLAIETKPLPDGYAFQFPGSDSVIARLFQFIEVERQCCPFFQFELSFAPQNGPVWLKLTGEEGVKAFIESELVKEG